MRKHCEKLLGRKTVSVSREASEILGGRALGAAVGALSGPGHRWEHAYASALPHPGRERGRTLLPRYLFRRGLSLRSPPLMTLKKPEFPHVNNLEFSFLFLKPKHLRGDWLQTSALPKSIYKTSTNLKPQFNLLEEQYCLNH